MKKGIIIGAGIGGLTAAIALAQKRVRVTLYEQAEEIKAVGAGIWIAPNGLKVYEKLGIERPIINAGKLLNTISVIDTNNKFISIINNSEVEKKHGFKTLAIHRAKLHDILASYIPSENLILKKSFVSYKQTDTSVTAFFGDGTAVEADFLINADGLKSSAREQITSSLKLRYSGQTCWRFTSNFILPKEDENSMYEIWSNKKGLRAAYSRINEDQIYCYITDYTQPGGVDNPLTIKEDLLTLCSEFQPIIKDIIKSSNTKSIIRTDLSDFIPLTKWVDGRVALLGDAAHATTPNLGQGACQAIEDAYVLANEIFVSNDIESALKSYENKRIKKATYITKTSWQFAQITNTTGFNKYLLKQIVRMTPKFVFNKQLDKIYSLDT